MSKCFIKENDQPEIEVTKEQFINYENNYGFISKFGWNHSATANFRKDRGFDKETPAIVYTFSYSGSRGKCVGRIEGHEDEREELNSCFKR